MEEVGGKHVQPSSALLAVVRRDQRRSAKTASSQPKEACADAANIVIVFLTPARACAMCGGSEDEEDECFVGMFRMWGKKPRFLKGQWFNDGRF